MKEKTAPKRKKAKRDTSKYELIVHLAKSQRMKPEDILRMSPKELAGFVDDGCRDLVIQYLNKNRKRMASHDLAFPGLRGSMSKIALVTGVDKYLRKQGLTRTDIFWPMRSGTYTRRNIVQLNADTTEVRKALERLRDLVPVTKQVLPVRATKRKAAKK